MSLAKTPDSTLRPSEDFNEALSHAQVIADIMAELADAAISPGVR